MRNGGDLRRKGRRIRRKGEVKEKEMKDGGGREGDELTREVGETKGKSGRGQI